MAVSPWKCFRGLKNKPYPKSRFNRSVPDPKLKIHNTGNRKAHVDTFPACLVLRSRATCRVSSESLEAARIASNKYLVKKLGKTEFHMVINKVPHDACRFNKMLSCAGADRLQSGMRGSFGKCLRKAARIKTNDALISIRTNKKNLAHVRYALQSAGTKLPCGIYIEESNNWGFTKVPREEYPVLREKRLLAPMGANVAVISHHGPLADHFEQMLTIKAPQTQLPFVKSDFKSSDLHRPFKKFNVVLAA